MSRDEKTRTSDLHVPNVARCQLCYTPSWLCLLSELARINRHSVFSIGKGTHFSFSHQIFLFTGGNILRNPASGEMQKVAVNVERRFHILVAYG